MARFFDIRGLASKIVALTIGTLTVGSVIVFGASSRFTGHLIPSANNAYDIGSPTSSVRNISASGTAAFSDMVLGGEGGSGTSTLRFNKPTCIPVISPTGTRYYITFPGGVATNSLISCE